MNGGESRAGRWLALAMLVVSALAAVSLLLLQIGSGHVQLDIWLGVLTGLGFAVLGPLIVQRQPGNRIGWLACLMGLGLTTGIAAAFLADYLLVTQAGRPWLAPWLAWFPTWPLWGAVALLFVFLPLLFPDGHFVSRRWRRFGRAAAILVALALLFRAFAPGPLLDMGNQALVIDNPLGFSLPGLDLPPLGSLANTVYAVTILLLALAAVTSLVRRWRRARGDERQQIKWFAFFVATAASFFVLLELAGQLFYPALFDTAIYDAAAAVAWLGFPLVIGLAILKYRLYDIDIIIRRTLVYGLLTAVLALVYFGVIVLLQQLFHSATGQGSPLAIVLSTLAIAALFAPLRRRIQATIDHRFYRRKYDAAQTIAAFSAVARDEVDLDRLTEALLATVQEAMQPERVSIWLSTDEEDATRKT